MVITAIDFVHLKASDLRHITASVSSGSEAEAILDAFATWLMLWKDGEWIDHEKIYLNAIDLGHCGVWKLVPLSTFIERLRGKVTTEVLTDLERI